MRRASAQRNTQGNKEEETGLCRGWNKEQGEETKEKQEKKNNKKNQEHVVYFYMHEKSSVVGWLKHE